jgi:hypothetical protein
VNVSVLEYVPVRSGSVALMGCLNAIATGSLETAAAQVALENSTTSGYGNENVPFIRWPGSDTVSMEPPGECWAGPTLPPRRSPDHRGKPDPGTSKVPVTGASSR